MISSISSSIWFSALAGADPPSPCSAFEIAKDNRLDNDGRRLGRIDVTDIDEVREFMAAAVATLFLFRGRGRYARKHLQISLEVLQLMRASSQTPLTALDIGIR